MPSYFSTHAYLATSMSQYPPASNTVALRRALLLTRGTLPAGPQTPQCSRTRLLLLVITLGSCRLTGNFQICSRLRAPRAVQWLAPERFVVGDVRPPFVFTSADRYVPGTGLGRIKLILGAQSINKIEAITYWTKILIHTPTGKVRSRSGYMTSSKTEIRVQVSGRGIHSKVLESD